MVAIWDLPEAELVAGLVHNGQVEGHQEQDRASCHAGMHQDGFCEVEDKPTQDEDHEDKAEAEVAGYKNGGATGSSPSLQAINPVRC